MNDGHENEMIGKYGIWGMVISSMGLFFTAQGIEDNFQRRNPFASGLFPKKMLPISIKSSESPSNSRENANEERQTFTQKGEQTVTKSGIQELDQSIERSTNEKALKEDNPLKNEKRAKILIEESETDELDDLSMAVSGKNKNTVFVLLGTGSIDRKRFAMIQVGQDKHLVEEGGFIKGKQVLQIKKEEIILLEGKKKIIYPLKKE